MTPFPSLNTMLQRLRQRTSIRGWSGVVGEGGGGGGEGEIARYKCVTVSSLSIHITTLSLRAVPAQLK